MGQAVKHLFAGNSSLSWQQAMQQQLRSLEELLTLRPDLAQHPLVESARIAKADLTHSFEMGISRYYASLIQADDPLCPILMQCLPDARELEDTFFTEPDPLAEESYMPVPGLTHRYVDRVLWYTNHSCAVYCRFCMRKRKVSRPPERGSQAEQKEILAYIQSHPEIKEVILSGGDPLSLADGRLDDILDNLRQIAHLRSIRLHSRMPVTLPQRITPELAKVFQKHYPLTLVTHFNHARELTAESKQAIKALRLAGVSVLNQSVLLKNINDSTEQQEALLLGLVQAGVLPYYLHRCDEVAGTSHMRVPLKKGLQILRDLRGRNPGIAIPRYIVDLPGGGGKISLEPEYLIETRTRQLGEQNFREYRFRNHAGQEFLIRD